MKHFDSLTCVSMYKVLIDQHDAVILSNKPIFITNNFPGCESDETNIYIMTIL